MLFIRLPYKTLIISITTQHILDLKCLLLRLPLLGSCAMAWMLGSLAISNCCRTSCKTKQCTSITADRSLKRRGSNKSGLFFPRISQDDYPLRSKHRNNKSKRSAQCVGIDFTAAGFINFRHPNFQQKLREIIY